MGGRCTSPAISTIIAFAVIILSLASNAFSDNQTDLFKKLQDRLAADGYDRAAVDRLYQHPDVYFDVDSVVRFFMHSEAKVNYGQFTEDEAIDRSKKYQKKHYVALAEAEQKYRVDKDVITAILLVESQLGGYVGSSVIVNTLSTMATLSDKEAKEALWQQIPKDKRLSRKTYNAKVKSKSRWAYRELKALLEYTEEQNLDISSIKGSYAGAMGLAQFMPSNILKLGVDGNGNGTIDLFEDEDAIFSIAYYLKYHGWRPGLSRKRAHRVILHYNNSTVYANTVLDVAAKLKG